VLNASGRRSTNAATAHVSSPVARLKQSDHRNIGFASRLKSSGLIDGRYVAAPPLRQMPVIPTIPSAAAYSPTSASVR
jgi:hypothetical protein